MLHGLNYKCGGVFTWPISMDTVFVGFKFLGRSPIVRLHEAATVCISTLPSFCNDLHHVRYRHYPETATQEQTLNWLDDCCDTIVAPPTTPPPQGFAKWRYTED